MASGRAWCSHHHTTTSVPPPPYNADQFRMSDCAASAGQRDCSSQYHEDARDHHHHHHQTIPKTPHTNQMGGNGQMMVDSRAHQATNQHKTHKSKINSGSGGAAARSSKFDDGPLEHRPHLPCAHQPHDSRKRSLVGAPLGRRPSNNQEQFVRSLVAPRSFLAHISVEPLAFLAIVALYIEFPAIQDLIWTKICLGVTGKYPTLYAPLTSPINQSMHLANSSASNQTLFASNSTTTTTPPFPTNATSFLNPMPADGGRIQPAQTGDAHDEQSYRRQHSLCDRMNRKAVPREIRQEIIDLDSLFWLKYQILICTLGLLASPYWGGLSDKIGRVLPMNAPIVAAILCNVISLAFGLLISMKSHALFHIEWLYVGGVIVGLSGGQTVLIMNMFSFISDNTTSEERSRRVTVLESVVFVAHGLGFFLSKMIMLLGLDPPDQPWLNRHFVAFGACILLNIVCVLYSLAKLRHHKFHRFLNNFEREQQEAAIMGPADPLGSGFNAHGAPANTLHGGGARLNELNDPTAQMSSCERLRELTSPTPDDPDGPIARSDKSNWSFRNSMITFKYYHETYEIATKKRDSRTVILLLLLSGFISALSLATLMSLFYTLVRMDPFVWDTSQYSWWNSVSSVTRGVALVTLTLLMRFSSWWSVPDPMVAAMGFLAKGAGLLTIGLAQSSAHLNWALFAFTLSEYSTPPVRSLLSKLVVREELGKLYSCLGVLQSLCFILGNIAFYVAFTVYADQFFFKLSFLVVAGIEFGAVILMIMIYTIIRRQMPHILL